MNASLSGYKWPIFLAWIAVSGLMLFGLGDAPLTDIDEGAFAEASREMLVRGDWVSPWLYDAPRFDKPVLIHWVQMTSFSIFGLSSWSARLPSVLAGLVWIATMASWSRLIAERIFTGSNQDAAYFWTLVFSGTSIGIFAISRASTADALLNALLALGLLALWKAFYSERDSSARTWARVCSATIGFGLITKGPIAVLIPFVAFIFAALSQTRAGLPRVKKLLSDPISWALLLLIGMPWYWFQYQAQGLPFLNSFLGDHNLGRFTSTMHGFSAGPWYYPIWICVALLPSSVFSFRIIRYFIGHKLWRNKPLWICWGVFLFVMLFFSASATKLPHYGFYGISGLIVIFGVIFSKITTASAGAAPPDFLIERVVISLILIVLALLPIWFGNFPGMIKDPYIQSVLIEAQKIFNERLGWFVLAAVGAIFIIVIRTVHSLAITLFTFLAVFYCGIVGPVMEAMRIPIYNAAQVVATVAEPVITWRLPAPSLSFAAGRVIKPGEPSRNMFVVLHSKDQSDLDLKLKNHVDGSMSVQLIWEQGGIRVIYVP